MTNKGRFIILYALGCAFLLMAFSCGTMKNYHLPFSPSLHGDVAAEWAPHRDTVEWWYMTGYLSDSLARPYFYQFTIFHGYSYLTEGYALHLSLVDFTGKRHTFFEEIQPTSDLIYGDRETITFNGNSIRLLPGRIEINAESREIGFSLTCLMDKEAAWHGKDGIIVMGHKDKSLERSFYYSFTRMTTTGTIRFPGSGESGNQEAVTGNSWFDRQWGRFTEKGWDWFSFRLTDGTEIMLFAFPATGHKEGSLIAKDGKTTIFDDYSYTTDKIVLFANEKYGNGWTVTFPDSLPYGTVKVVPISQDQYNPGSLNQYWEGLCHVVDGSGQPLGYCVVETTLQANN